MKFQNIRRMGILVFVLFLALTLTLALTAPGWATGLEGTPPPEPTATPNNTEFRILVDDAIKNDVTVDVKIGNVLSLGNQWNPKEPGTCTYEWRITDQYGNDPSGVSWEIDSSDKNGRKLTVKILNPDDEKVIITAIARPILGNDTYEASCTLKIAPLTLRIADADNFDVSRLSLKIGDEPNLTVGWANQKDPPQGLKIQYRWSCEQTASVQLSDSPVTINKTGNDLASKQTTLKVKALQATAAPVKVTVEAYWIPEGNMASVGTQLLDTYTFTVAVADSGLSIAGTASELITGKSTTLEAKWVGTTAPEGAEYTWKYLVDGEESDAVTFSAKTSTASSPFTTKETAVTVRAGNGEADGVVTCTTTVNGVSVTKEYPLKIIKPDVSLKGVTGDTLTLTYGQTAELEAVLTPDPSDKDTAVTYSWTYSNSQTKDVTFNPGSPNTSNKTQATVNSIPADGTSETITVTAAWNTGASVSKEYKLKVETPKVSIKADKTILKIGDLATLEAVLPEGTSTTGLKYEWKVDTTANTVSSSGANTAKLSVRALSATAATSDTVNVTLTVSSGSTLIGTANLTLRITKPKLTVTADGKTLESNQVLTAEIGREIELGAAWSTGTEPSSEISGEKFTWEWTSGAAVSILPANEPTTTITAKQGTGETPATVTVKVTWTGTSGNRTATVEATYDVKIAITGPSLSILADGKGVDGSEEDPLKLEIDKKVSLTAQLVDGPKDDVEYEWKCVEVEGEAESNVDKDVILFEPVKDSNQKETKEAAITAKAATEKKVKITVTAKWPGGAAADFPTATCWATVLVPAESVELYQGDKLIKDTDELTLALNGDPVTLTAVVLPEGAKQAVTWSTSDPKVADVKDGVVTPVGVGEAVITVKTEDGGHTATCKVTVKPSAITGIAFTTSGPIVRANTDPASWDLSVALLPEGAGLAENETLNWSVTVNKGGLKTPLKLSADGLTARITSGDPGEYTVTVAYVSADGKTSVSRSIEVIVSGITLTRQEVRMLVGQNTTIAIDQAFGFAGSGSTTDVEWSSSDPSAVSVMYGELTGWKLGKDIVITAVKNGYTAECIVNVTEDEEAIANNGGRGYTASPGDPLKLSEVWDELNQISKNKTGDRYANGEPVGNGLPLAYITNVTVSTSQGTLYYNYSSEASPGEGIRLTDRFAKSPDNTQKRIDLLYFVPKQGFKGTAEITFIGWAGDASFSGVIKVEVSGAEERISYRTQAGVPVYFQADDFDAVSRSQNGRGVNYVTFDLPPAGQGVLYYNYVGGDGIRVSASTRFSQSGRYTIGDVCFVPNAAFKGNEVTIKFHGVDTAGTAFHGSVVVSVTPSGEDSSGGFLSGERGKPVTFQSGLFNNACREAINDALSFVTFKLPAMEEGMLYYNYRSAGDFDSRVNPTTRYFFSGTPGINNVAFVPAPNAAGMIAISYTGYGTSGATFDGTLYIDLDGVDPIYYFAAKNNAAAFDEDDFINAGLYQMDAKVSYVIFTGMSDTGLGKLYYNRTSSVSGRTEITPSAASAARYYVSPTSSQNGLGRVSFRAGNVVGSVTITYAAYDSSDKRLFDSSVVVQVGALTPADTSVSCTTGGQAGLSASALRNACRPAMSEDLSYIEITSVPDPAAGCLYLNYYGFGTGTVVAPGDRIYYSGSPGISQLKFVPHAGFTGEAEITYIGHSSDSQEQVSGRVMVTVTRSVRSQYFNDMGGYEWAIDSVDYLRQNRTVEGVGDNQFAPGTTIIRGDFILMLVRAYGFTASGSASYRDVSAGDYYAEAIRIATVLGIVQGYDGYFNPKAPLSRQDAMVMIFRSLKAGGMTITNGLTADFASFYDGGQIDSYALEALGSLVRMGVVQGDGNGYLRPQGLLNRAEAAKLLHTIMTL